MTVERIEGLLLAGDYQGAREAAEQQLDQGDLPPQVEAQVCLLVCRACTAAADLFTAVRYGQRAVARAAQQSCALTSIYAQLALGCACARLGDAPPAREHLLTAIGSLAMRPNPGALVGEAYYHLSLVHRLRRDLRLAAKALGQAAELLQQHGRIRDGARATLELAGCFLQLGDPAQARPQLEAVAVYVSERADPEVATDLLCARALCHRLEGDLDASVSLCQAVLAQAGAGAGQLAEAAWIMGENLLDRGQAGEATSFAVLALEHAVQTGSAALMNRVGDLRRRATLPANDNIL